MSEEQQKPREESEETDLQPIRRGEESPHFILAVEALRHAQSLGIKSDTKLENNKKSPEEFALITQGVYDARELVYGIFDEAWQLFLDEGASEQDNNLYDGLLYLIFNEKVKKFSLANCGELGALILDYFHEKNFNGVVELFSNNGHVFGVIERSIVIDPLLDRIYRLSEFSTYGSGFSSQLEETPEGFKACHKLVPCSKFSKEEGNLLGLQRAHEFLEICINRKLNDIITAIHTIDPNFEKNIRQYDQRIVRIYKLVKRALEQGNFLTESPGSKKEEKEKKSDAKHSELSPKFELDDFLQLKAFIFGELVGFINTKHIQSCLMAQAILRKIISSKKTSESKHTQGQDKEEIERKSDLKRLEQSQRSEHAEPRYQPNPYLFFPSRESSRPIASSSHVLPSHFSEELENELNDIFKETGISIANLHKYALDTATDSHLRMIRLLRPYLRNAHQGKKPSLSLDDIDRIASLPTQQQDREVSQLMIAYRYIEARLISIEDARKLSFNALFHLSQYEGTDKKMLRKQLATIPKEKSDNQSQAPIPKESKSRFGRS